MTSIQQLCDEFMSSRRREALQKALGGETAIISVYNLAGSAPAMMLARSIRARYPRVVVGDSLDDAGYIYHDLSRILGEDRVLLFPRATSATSDTAKSIPLRRYCAPKPSTSGIPTARRPMW